mmetsp:Transcript_6704/g.25108  ORF Transcript_6704/g.25108 Transcript_6704/m.25108 type:complete len:201 (-) Transcript_6704:4730-5332(-)
MTRRRKKSKTVIRWRLPLPPLPPQKQRGTEADPRITICLMTKRRQLLQPRRTKRQRKLPQRKIERRCPKRAKRSRRLRKERSAIKNWKSLQHTRKRSPPNQAKKRAKRQSYRQRKGPSPPRQLLKRRQWSRNDALPQPPRSMKRARAMESLLSQRQVTQRRPPLPQQLPQPRALRRHQLQTKKSPKRRLQEAQRRNSVNA